MSDETYYENFRKTGLIIRILGVIMIILIVLIQFTVIEFPESFHIENDAIYWNIAVLGILVMIIIGVCFIIYADYNLKTIKNT